MNNLKKQMDFLFEIDKVKGILRQSVILGDVERRENDAEHSWHMALCAMVLGKYVDVGEVVTERAIKMMLIHDIVEIYSNDVPAFSNFSKEEKFRKELAAAEKIFGSLPEEQGKEFLKLWLEFENMETNESKFANVFDRFQGFMQNLTSDGHTWKKWSVTEDMVIKRLEPILKYAPILYKEVVRPAIDEYMTKGIIKK